MPKVPTYDNFQTTPSTLPNAQFNEGLVSPDRAKRPFQEMQALGEAVGRAGDTMGAIQLEAQKRANDLRVQDAVNRAKETALKLTFDKEYGYSNIKGLNALERESGKPLAEEYTGLLDKSISDIGATLGNDAQREAFAAHARDMRTSFYGDVLNHEGNEFKTYAMSVREGTIKNSINEIGLYYDKPDRVNASINAIKTAAYDAGKLQGKSAEEIEANIRDLTSGAHLSAISAALENGNIEYADRYVKQYSKDMSADDLLRAHGKITPELDSKLALGVANQVMSEATAKLQTGNSDRAFNVLLNTESGGRQFDRNGKPLTSSAGAIGIAQVMPATAPEAAKLAGVEWDEELYKTDAIYNMQLGKAYFEKQLQDFGGNLAYAYAAYNAGPGAARNAIKAAQKDGGDWLAQLPKETQDYVRKNMKSYQAGEGKFSRPSLSELQDRVREIIGTDSPQRLKLALDETERRYEATTKAMKQKAEENKASAMQALIDNGGQYNALSPNIKSAVDPEDMDEVMDFANKIAKGVEPQTDWSLYYELKSDPSKINDTNLAAYRSKLGDTEFKELVNLQGDVRKGKGDYATTMRSVKDVMDQYLVEAGINPNPKTGDSDAAKVGILWNQAEARVRTLERTLQRKAKPEEINAEIARMFTKVETKGLLFGSSKPLGLVTGDDKVVVPEEDRLNITAALKAYGKPVDEANILKYYKRSKGIE